MTRTRRSAVTSSCLVLAALSAPSCEVLAPALARLAFHEELATRWAPIHHQDVDPTGDHSLGGASDYITAMDFDGDWVMTNNWDHAELGPYDAVAYYTVVETETHWFVTYAFFHPRDWSESPFGIDEHENDLEGVMLIVRRPANGDEPELGTLLGAVTVFHSDFFAFTPEGSPLEDGVEDIDGELRLATFEGAGHPVTAQEAKGHGLKAEPFVEIEGGDGVVYFPTGTAEVPSGPNDRNVGYELKNMFLPGELWARQNDSETFANPGDLAGDGGNKANAPWGWDDHDDGPVFRGEIATDPVKLVKRYFSNLGSFSETYTYNPYRENP